MEACRDANKSRALRMSAAYFNVSIAYTMTVLFRLEASNQ